MIKNKGLKAILISLLIVFSTSCFSLLFVNAYKTFTKKEPQAATTYNFASGAITKDSYDEYTIGNLTALQNFEKSVKIGISFYDYTNKKPKTVKLTSDIDCQGESIGIGYYDDSNSAYGVIFDYIFQGNFNGQNFTIKNVSI